jgi:GT2 family glycosyltransferase
MRALVRLLSAVVVNYRSAALAASCVASLRREAAADGVPLEVVVVDNSADPEERQLLGALDGARYLPLEENAGYAGGLARGAAAAAGDVLLLANPDLLLTHGALAPLLAALERPDAGAAGPRFTWDEEGRWLLPPLFVPTPGGEVAKILARSRLGFRGPLHRAWRAVALPQWEASVTTNVPALVGALVAVPRRTWEEVGPFDARYPLYYEDTDWFARLARAGRKAYLVPGARVVHLHGQSTGRASESALASFLASERRYFDLHFSAPGRALRAAAAALLPAAPFPGLPDRAPPVRLEWRARGRVLAELTTVPEGVPAAGRFVEGSTLELSAADWERLPCGPVFLRVSERDSGRIVAETAFRKPGGVRAGREAGRA